MNVVAVVAHPDDELLGPGGTLVKHVANGDQVDVVFMCENDSVRGGLRQNQRHALQIAESAGWAAHWMGYPDQRLDKQDFVEICGEKLGNILDSCDPRRVYTHWYHDLNRDHRFVSEAVRVATRRRYCSILEFPTPSSTEYSEVQFQADTYADLTGTPIESKLALWQMYTHEQQPSPWPRNANYLRSAAAYWGGHVGMLYAEVFHTVRRLE